MYKMSTDICMFTCIVLYLQTRNKSQKLQDTQNSINQSINQYNALISGDKSAEEPSPIIMNNLRIDSDVSPVQNTVCDFPVAFDF